jgi:hypothetical protein
MLATSKTVVVERLKTSKPGDEKNDEIAALILEFLGKHLWIPERRMMPRTGTSM